MPRTFIYSLVFLLLAVTVTPAHAAKNKTAQDPDTDFSAFRTYAWRGKDVSEMLGSDVRSAAEQVLRSKGYERVDADQDPDLWFEYNAGSADVLRAGWRLTIGWYGDLWAIPGARSRVEAGLAILCTTNARGDGEDRAVWGGRSLMAGNTPDALLVMTSRVGKVTRKLMKSFPER